MLILTHSSLLLPTQPLTNSRYARRLHLACRRGFVRQEDLGHRLPLHVLYQGDRPAERPSDDQNAIGHALERRDVLGDGRARGLDMGDHGAETKLCIELPGRCAA